MTARLLDGGDDGVCGVLTSGGTESIVLAAKAHRDFYREVRWDGGDDEVPAWFWADSDVLDVLVLVRSGFGFRSIRIDHHSIMKYHHSIIAS